MSAGDEARLRNRRKNLLGCLLALPFLGCCLYGAIWPVYKPDWVRRSIRPGMTLRQVLEQNRRHLGCELTIADVNSSGIVLAQGHLWPDGGRIRLRSTATRDLLRFEEALTRIEGEIAAITTSSGYAASLMFSPHVDVYRYVRFRLDPSGKVTSVDPR